MDGRGDEAEQAKLVAEFGRLASKAVSRVFYNPVISSQSQHPESEQYI
jgi:hypothetical protein